MPLTPKTFDTLLTLVRERGRVVEKSELMEILWPDTAVEENNLSQQISAARKALGERSDEGRFIRTVPGHGYRFVAEVEEVVWSAAATPPLSERRHGRRTPYLVLPLSVVATVIVLLGFVIFGRKLARAKRGYVSPFFIANAYLGVGDKENGFAWLQKSYEERSEFLVFINVAPSFDDVRGDPRFIELLKRVGPATSPPRPAPASPSAPRS